MPKPKPDPKPMTPAEFVALVEPHLHSLGFREVLHVVGVHNPIAFYRGDENIGNGMTVHDASLLLLGAIVAEWPNGIHLFRTDYGWVCDITNDESALPLTGSGNTPIEAALLARAEARKAQQ